MVERAGVEQHSGKDEIVVRECTTFDEFDCCMELQRAAFNLPEVEVSPRRHFVVTRSAGGFTLGAFRGARLVGFVHQLAAVREREIIGYSHMMAVAPDEQNSGIGARLKWAQRERALSDGITFIRWTWDPVQARNAHFNLNRLGVVVRSYTRNFYGTDYNVHACDKALGIDSDRLVAEWNLRSPRVAELARRHHTQITGANDTGRDASTVEQSAVASIVEIPADWGAMLREDRATAQLEHRRIRAEFEAALSTNLICAGFDRAAARPRYLFYESE